MLALKKAEQSDEIVARVVEIDGKPASSVHIAFASPVVAAREIDAQERSFGPAKVQAGEVVAAFRAYQPRSFAIKLGPAAAKVAVPDFATVKLPYDVSVASLD